MLAAGGTASAPTANNAAGVGRSACGAKLRMRAGDRSTVRHLPYQFFT